MKGQRKTQSARRGWGIAILGASAILAIVAALLLILDWPGGDLGKSARTAPRPPSHVATCRSVEHWSGRNTTNDVLRNILVATLKDAGAARTSFGALAARLPAEATLTLFGESLLLTLPVTEANACDYWLAEFQRLDQSAWIGRTNQSISASLLFVTPGGPAATNLLEELDEYLQVAGLGDLVPPWSPEAIHPTYQSARRTRRMWHVINTNTAAAWHSSAVKDIARQIAAANQRGARAEAQALIEKQETVKKREAAKIRDDLRGRGFDGELLDFHARFAELANTNQTGRLALHRLLAHKLGEAAARGESAQLHPSHGMRSGFYRVHGAVIEMKWATFTHGPTGLPSFLEWLCRNHCTGIKYEIFRGSPLGENDR